MAQKFLRMYLLFILVIFTVGNFIKAVPVKQEVTDDKTKIQKRDSLKIVSTSADLGIDLVVSKVKLTRGLFAGEYKIQIVPYIKNMCNGRTGTRIKVWLPHIAAEWIEGGIGPKEEKSAGALYLPDNPDRPARVGAFKVVVDNNNTIKENNETNNECSGITLESTESAKTHICPKIGPHCIQPEINRKDIEKKYQRN